MIRAAGLCVLILLAALALRAPKLADRPMHADEAVLADKFGTLLDTGAWQYDPRDHHGPLLELATLLTAAGRYRDVTETTLRAVPLVCGLLLVLMPLALIDALGKWEALAASALTTLSPALVYYSRYYIPEMLLTTLTAALIVCGYRYTRTRHAAWALAAGAALGLMLATKETAVIPAACLAAIALRRPRWPIAAAACLAAAIAAALLGPANLLPAAQSYWQRGIHASLHRHPWYYYATLIAWPEGPILALAAAGAILVRTPFARFLAIYTAALAAVYSLIPYKTPWCALGFLYAATLLAGAGAVALLRTRFRHAAAALLILSAAHLGFYAWRDAFPLASDPRNPYVYAHTTRDVYAMRDAIARAAAGPDAAIQIISSKNLWPLPWYLRQFPRAEWRRAPGPGFRPAPLILATPDIEPALLHELYEVPPPGRVTLYAPLFDRPLELRPGVEVRGYAAVN